MIFLFPIWFPLCMPTPLPLQKLWIPPWPCWPPRCPQSLQFKLHPPVTPLEAAKPPLLNGFSTAALCWTGNKDLESHVLPSWKVWETRNQGNYVCIGEKFTQCSHSAAHLHAALAPSRALSFRRTVLSKQTGRPVPLWCESLTSLIRLKETGTAFSTEGAFLQY